MNVYFFFGQTRNAPYSSVALLLVLVFAMCPLYLFPSGGFQLVDIVIIFISLIIFMSMNVTEIKTAMYLVGPFVPYVAWAVTINAYYSMSSVSPFPYLLTGTQVVYVFYLLFLFSLVFKRLLSNQKGISFIYCALLMSCITPFLLPARSLYHREALTFNNPNQLAFYATLLCFMVLVLNEFKDTVQNKKVKFNCYDILNLIIIIVANIFAFISLSRSGIISIIIFDVVFVFIELVKCTNVVSARIIMVCIIACFAIGVLGFGGNGKMMTYYGEGYMEKFQRRFSKENINDLYSRTFGLIEVDYDLTMLIGKGGWESAYPKNRHLMELERKECHNALGQVFNSYGIIGVLLFVGASIFFVFRIGWYPLQKWLLVAPLVITHLSHNCIRFRYWWIALALFSVTSLCAFQSTSSRREK